MPPRTDLQPLLERVAAEDQRAFGELYDATGPYVFGVVRRVLGDSRRVEDVTQEVYLQVWRTASSFDPDRGSAWSWLALLARSRAVDRLRADRSYGDAVDEVERQPESAPVGGHGTNPSAEAARVERGEILRGALEELPDEQRRALELAFFRGWTHREIAERTEIPLGTVKTRIRTGMRKLRDVLGSALGR